MAQLSVDEEIDQALADYTAGLYAAAEIRYRRVLDVDPDNPDALNLLGLLLQHDGRHAEAIDLISRALAIDPDFPEALTNLARVQRVAGSPQDAIVSAGRAIELDPDLAEAHLQFGRALIDCGDYAAAAGPLERALALEPGNRDARSNLANLALMRADYASAMAHYDHLLRAEGPSVDVLIGIGTAEREMDRLDEALAYHQQAVREAPDLADAQLALAATHGRRSETAAAVQACRRAVAISPKRADAWRLLGANLGYLGQFEEAAACHREALALDPNMPETWRDLSMLRQFGSPVEIHELQSCLDDDTKPDTERAAAGFALGRVLDETGNTDHAFDAYARANALVRESLAKRGQRFDLTGFRSAIDWTIATFQPTLFRKMAGCGAAWDAPVFIVGMPRSGTSLIEQIAASHGSVFGAGERKDFMRLVTELGDGAIQTVPTLWDKDQMAALTAAHADSMARLSDSAARVIDKMPDNILLLGQIAVLFPRARVIFCRRDPRDVGLSAFFQQFSDGQAWSFDLADCAARIQETERLTEHWRRVLPLPMLDMDYETVVANPEAESRRLIDFLGLPWDPACLSFHETVRPVTTASYWQVRQPIYQASAGKWTRYQRHLRPLLLGLVGLVEPSDDAWPALLADTEAALVAAAQHHHLRRIAAAEAIYTKLIDIIPDDPRLLHLLGLLKLNKGESTEAIALISRSLQTDPDAPAALLDLSRAYRHAAQPLEAVATARRAIASVNGLAAGFVELASGLMMLDEIPEARAAAEQALVLDPASAEALCVLARINGGSGKPDTAEALFRQALVLAPLHFEPVVGLAAALADQDLLEPALAQYQHAADLFPEIMPVHRDMARAAVKAHRPDIAARACQAGLALDPYQADLKLMLAQARVMLGQFADAETLYREILTADPSNGVAFNGLMKMHSSRETESDTIISRTRHIFVDSDRSIADRVGAAFALAHAYEKQEDYDNAFAAYQDANELAAQAHPASAIDQQLETLRKDVDWLIDTFQPALFEACQDLNHPSELPVHIVGMPRSGTTLIEQILASHGDVFGDGERSYLQPFIDGDLLAHVRPTSWRVAEKRQQVEALLLRIKGRSGGALRVTNKLPDNVLLVGHIAIMFPRSRFISCKRDLRDVCLSCFTQNFQEAGLIWTTSLESCAARAREIARLADHWARVVPSPYLEVAYEDLVADLEGQSRRMVDFLGLPWDPACLAYHRTERPVMTASYWQVRQPIYASSIGRWKLYRRHLGPLLDGLAGLVPDDD